MHKLPTSLVEKFGRKLPDKAELCCNQNTNT